MMGLLYAFALALHGRIQMHSVLQNGRACHVYEISKASQNEGEGKEGSSFSTGPARCASRMGFRLGNGAIRLLESLGFSPLRQPT